MIYIVKYSYKHMEKEIFSHNISIVEELKIIKYDSYYEVVLHKLESQIIQNYLMQLQ